jgi:diguanylate cyclase (GGDEF)-like protein
MVQGEAAGSDGVTRRQVYIGASALVASVAIYFTVCQILPAGSLALVALADFGFLVVELVGLFACLLAFRWGRGRSDRLVWIALGLWLVLNLFGDSVWAYYEVFRHAEVPVPGLADIGYLGSYLVALVAILVAAWRASGRMRALETMLDATMFTIGAAALVWPSVLGPMLTESGSGLEYWVTLAYPIGDLLIVLAFVSFFLGSTGSGRTRPRLFSLVICLAFLCQTVADSAYFYSIDGYEAGSWIDPVWLLSFALVGIAALMGIRSARETSATHATHGAISERPIGRDDFSSSRRRILIPYVALVLLVVVMGVELHGSGWQWSRDAWGPFYLGFALVVLLVGRQYLILAQNRRLNVNLLHTSGELGAKLGDLADLNQRLEILNDRAHYLNSLGTLPEIADAALELACSFDRSPGGWISLNEADGSESILAIRGTVSQDLLEDSELRSLDIKLGLLRVIPLDIRGESLGTIFVLMLDAGSTQPDLLPVIAAHAATAIDNAQKYEEVVHQAERDPLTGLYNHRGIHKRLAGEGLRAQRNGSDLSLIMIDLDDFKLLNDTYGHPVGDSTLRQVSDAIRSVLRHADLAGRVGGDELLIVLPNTGAEGALLLGERLIETLRDRPYVTPGGHPVPVGLSLGIATYPDDAQSLGQLIERADTNLYTSKQRGGNTVTGSPVEEKTHTSTDGVLGVAGRLLNVVGARDHYTRLHSEHVVLYALSLGEAIGLSDESLGTLHMAAMLHDVGKIGVPTQLLRKPTPLTPAEEDMVRRHAEIGASVINDMPRLAEVAEAVHAHHEHHDGNGYPAELSGEEIPLLARILAISDAYSAMTLDRPYRKTMTREQARTELRAGAGSQFDPELVDRFIQILDAQDARTACAHAEAV